ncbi:MAG: hypothetical protein KDJ52_10650 [Anaerolineae bacterium]|nr:hypothetical protein [Anaerolineae bacterium]
MFQHIIDYLVPSILQKSTNQDDLNIGLEQERERILTGLLRAVTLLGIITLLANIPSVLRDKYWILFAMYTLCAGLVIVVTVNRQLAYRLRAGLFLLIAYLVGGLDLLNFGLGGDGRVFLFGFCTAAVILMGMPAGLIAWVLSFLTLFLTGWLISVGWIQLFNLPFIPSAPLTFEGVVLSTLTFSLTTGVIMTALYALLRSFITAWQRERLAINSLQDERNLLEMRVIERTEELTQAHDHALASSRFKTELLAKVSHELRTPLNAILGFAELLEIGQYGPLTGKQLIPLQEIADSALYQTRLVNELIDQAQLEAGKVTLYVSSFAPLDVITQPLNTLQPLAHNKGLTLTGSLAPDLLPTLSGDLVRLQQILLNLVGNAIKFTDTGQIQVDIYQPDLLHWAMRVTDTGCGIPPEAQECIFEPFVQVDGSLTRLHSGTGLGLSLVKQLTTLMGGRITLASQIGQGSTFTITLPLTPVENAVI